MALRKRVFIVIMLVFFCLVTILYSTFVAILRSRFLALEAQDVRNCVEQALSALDEELLALDTTALDWASWDDTYDFMQEANQEYISLNLIDDTFVALRLNMLLLIDDSDQIVFSKGFDLELERAVPVPPDLSEYLQDGLPFRQPEKPGGWTGVILLRQDPMLVASKPILTSEDKGPALGTLVMGRYLGPAEIGRLAEATRLSLSVHPVDAARMPPDFHIALSSLLQQGPVFVNPLDGESVAGYALVDDLYGEPALLMRVDVSREIYREGMFSTRYYLASLLVVWLVFSVLTWQLLRRLVIDQLTRLSETMNAIRADGDLSMRVPASSTSELSSLADAINEMLKALRDSQHELRESEQALQDRNRELELLILTAQTLNTTLDLDKILISFLEAVRSLMGTVASSIWLRDAEAGELVCVQAAGPHRESVLGWRLGLEQGIVGWVARTGETLRVPDADTDERHFQDIDRLTGLALRSILCVPLEARQGTVGVLEVVDTEIDRFQPADQRLLESLAASAAIAIDNARLFDAVHANEADLRNLSARLIEVQEQERRHIAQELHDELGQLLTAIKINVDLARRRLPDKSIALQRRLEDASGLTDQVLSNVRSMTIELRPTLLDDMGVVPALRWYLKRYARHTGIQTQLQAPEQATRLAPEIETAIYRVAQEALTNVARHAGATQVWVRLAYAGDTVLASIQDNGQGFNVEEQVGQSGERQSLGLTGIQERVMLLGGRAVIDSESGEGTLIEVELPLRYRSEHRE